MPFMRFKTSCAAATAVVPDPQNTSMTRDEIEDHFRKSMQKEYGDEFEVKIEWLDVLEPDETGKQRCFVCKVK